MAASKTTDWLITAGPNDETIRVPYATIRGRRDGPRVLVVAGVHGAEYVGIEAAKRLHAAVDADTLAGTLVTVPCLNLPAFYGLTPHVNPIDGLNPARVFPGRADGSNTERMVHLLWEELARPADVVLDLHGGDMEEELVDYSQVNLTGNERVDAAAEALALASDLPFLVRRPPPDVLPLDHTGLHPLAASHGKVAVLLESGSHGVLDDGETHTLLRSLQNCLRELKMIPGDVERARTPRVLRRFTGIAARAEGFWYPAIRKGDEVRRGQKIGEMRGFFDEPLGLVTSDENAIVLGVITTPPRRAGDMLVGLGTID